MLARAFLVLALLASAARADNGAVAMLPLDAGPKLEVYGQALASEISKALGEAKIDVVVVLAGMAVPEHALLVVDGKIATAKGGAIELSIRVRDPKAGKTIQTFQATAASLGKIDKATAELTQKVLPVVKTELTELTKKPAVVEPPQPPVRMEPRLAPMKPLLVGVKGDEPFRGALADAVTGWVGAAHRAPTTIDAVSLAPKMIAKTVAGSTADRAIAFEVLSFRVWDEKVSAGGATARVPMGKARVRVRISDASQVLFDRVVFTDTVIGDHAMARDQMAARLAREVLAILRPHVRRTVPAWP